MDQHHHPIEVAAALGLAALDALTLITVALVALVLTAARWSPHSQPEPAPAAMQPSLPAMTTPPRPRSWRAATTDPRVHDHSDERGSGDGLWLYLRRPWRCPDTDLSFVHEWTVRETLDSLQRCYRDPEWWDRIYGPEGCD